MQYTTNFNLKKPEGTDVVNIDDLNYNADIIDTKLGSHNSEIADARGGFDTLREKLDSYAVNVKDFGAKGDGVTDDKSAFELALNTLISKGGGRLIIPRPSQFYSINDGININVSDNIYLEIVGEGSPEIRLVKNVTTNIFSIIASNPLNTKVIIRGIKFSGIGVPEQWNETDFSKLTTVTAVRLDINDVIIEDCSFENIYGDGINIQRYNNAYVNHCVFTNVGGHWYENNQYDSFGDAVYFGNSNSTTSIAKVSNSHLEGYPSDRPRLSRIGVTFEGQTGIGIIQGCYIEGYDRSIHIENAPTAQILVENTHINRFNLATFIDTGLSRIIFRGIKYTNQISNYNSQSGIIGIYGITTHPDLVVFENCLFDINNNCNANAFENIRVNSCTFISNPGQMTWSGGSSMWVNCYMKGKVFHGYRHQIKIMNGCRLVGAGTDAEQILNMDGGTGSIEHMTNCRVENGFISWEFMDSIFESCVFIKTTTLTNDGFLKPYGVSAIIKDCLLLSPDDFNFVVTGWGGADYLGDSYKKINGVLSKVASTVT